MRESDLSSKLDTYQEEIATLAEFMAFHAPQDLAGGDVFKRGYVTACRSALVRLQDAGLRVDVAVLSRVLSACRALKV